MPSKRTFISFFIAITFFLPVTLSACDILPEPQQVAGVEGTITPTATKEPSGYQAIDPESCILADWGSMEAERRLVGNTFWAQGNLLAFQPKQDGQPERIAYLAPNDRSSWLTGELRAAIGPDFTEHITLAPNVLANGNLTWSPSGDTLAFIAYRAEDGLYTVMIVEADGSGLTDLFPADLARTDARSSRKAIMAWKDNRTLEILASCGEECLQGFDVDISQPDSPILVPTPIADYKALDEKLKIQRLQHPTPTGEAKIFPKYFNNPHWSPDERSVVYLDRKALLWYLSIDRKINFLLDIGLRDVYETRWSSGSDYLAVRAEDRVFLFKLNCK